MSDGFKAHDARLGPKLGQAQASGLSGLARRVEAARGRVRAEELQRRAAGAAGADQGEPTRTPDRSAGRPAPAGSQDSTDDVVAKEVKPERTGGGRGTELDGAIVKASPAASTGKSGRKVGRPKFEGVRPWVAAGVSRAEWYRRRRAGGR